MDRLGWKDCTETLEHQRRVIQFVQRDLNQSLVPKDGIIYAIALLGLVEVRSRPRLLSR